MSASERDRTDASSGPVLGRTTPGSEPAAPTPPTPATGGQEPHRRPRSRLRPVALAALIASLTVGILITVFAAQNSQGVEVHFLGYSSQSAPQFVVILLSVVLGLLIGLLLGLSRRRTRT